MSNSTYSSVEHKALKLLNKIQRYLPKIGFLVAAVAAGLAQTASRKTKAK